MQSAWRTLPGFGWRLMAGPRPATRVPKNRLPMGFGCPSFGTSTKKENSKLLIDTELSSSTTANVMSLNSNIRVSSEEESTSPRSLSVDSTRDRKIDTKPDPFNNRVMLVDGTGMMYRSYYKLLAKLQHGLLEHADGNGD